MKISKSPRPLWNDDDDDPDDRPRSIEEQVQMRAHSKRLEDCTLPEGFRLVTPRPRQFWMDHQLMWAFCLAWTGLHVEYRFVARYHATVCDEHQLRWALEEFTGELLAAGMPVGDSGRTTTPVLVMPSPLGQLRAAL